jgi:gas vesicle protein
MATRGSARSSAVATEHSTERIRGPHPARGRPLPRASGVSTRFRDESGGVECSQSDALVAHTQPPERGTSMTMSDQTSDGGALDTAKEQAAHVAEKAADHGRDVAGVAKEEAANVAGEAKDQAKDLLRQTQEELRQQAAQQQERVAAGLRSVSDELSQMAQSSESRGVASEVVRQAADRTAGVASWLGDRDPGSLLGEVKSYARRNPGTFIAVAAVAGALAGRLTRSLASGAAGSGGSTGSTGSGQPGLGGDAARNEALPPERAPMRPPTARIVPASGDPAASAQGLVDAEPLLTDVPVAETDPSAPYGSRL